MTDQWLVTADGTDQPISGYQLLIGNQAPRIEVIAHSLAQINRFTGHATRPYSVAEHSLLVCDIMAARGLDHHAQRAGLMHDAHECLAGDISSPAKWVIGVPWHCFENPLALMVQKQYHLKTANTAYRVDIKTADLTALATERRDLMRFDAQRNAPWGVIDHPGAEVAPMEGVDLNNPARIAMTWRHHRDAFLARYRALDAQCKVIAGATA
ncbi:hypothetical protein [Acidovorax sp. ACV01]|uniref:hypothetical protein n=1 Tax=Acidovorax sp. ACV01 TaxID=2769311 RepID=UPI001782CC13|nr:hypothetical protein [Acidovorax sp. ACV01]MBD9395169.1 hypothetical protein [Acidovorax sp. ACV01]